jgi:peptidoglycan/LPS O-acetylase OafA/YrhL
LAVVRALGTRQSAAETLLKLALTSVVVVALLLPAVFAGRRRGLPRRLLAWRPLAWLGLVSYGVYLWHLPIAELLALGTSPHFTAGGLDLTASLPAPTVALLILTLAASCAIAWASYRVVELPFLRRKER